MKKLFLLLIVNCTLLYVNCFAQVYQINFAGSGASTTVDSVIIENLTQCISVSLESGYDTLFLNGHAGINELSNSADNALHIYPNPMTGYCLFDFQAIAQGEATISLSDVAGKRITQTQEFLIKGNHTFSLNGLGSGIYVLQVKSSQYEYTSKIISSGLTSGITEIKHIEEAPVNVSNTSVMKGLKSNKTSVNLLYNPNDTLKLTGFSGGIYKTITMLVATQSQTVFFDFIACTDKDNNNYAVVKIGNQIWMEENLKTTTYNDGTAIPNSIGNSAWTTLTTPAYCWHNDSVKYKNIYGGLYNWYAVNTGKLCPTGWFVPDSSDWVTLATNLGGAGITGGKLKETCSTDWATPNKDATNSSGFTALPGGSRYYLDGNFYFPGTWGYWWSITEGTTGLAWHVYLENIYSSLFLVDNSQADGFSVRCIKETK